MADWTNILAEGLSPGAIFMIVVAVIVAIANVLAKAKQTESTKEKMREERIRREREARTENTRRHEPSRPNPARVPKKQNQTRAAPRPAPPPPLPVVPTVRAVTTKEPDAPLESRSRVAASEAARNVRLMLQPAGIREAFILSEVLGKPKSLRQD